MESDKKPMNPAVETYASDMAEALRDDQGGVIRKILKGEEERENEKERFPESKRNKLFMAASALFVVLGLGVVIYVIENRSADIFETRQEFAPLIFTDRTAFVDVTGFEKEGIAAMFRAEMDGNELNIGGVKGVYLTLGREVVGLRRFTELLGMSFIPGDPELVYDTFLAGAVKTDEPGNTDGLGFFILLKSKTSADIFGSLRAWEGKMLLDLHKLMGVAVEDENTYLLAQPFKDDLIDNKNARVLADKGGNPVLLYIFADNNSVVVSDSVEAAREVMRSLASKSTKE